MTREIKDKIWKYNRLYSRNLKADRFESSRELIFILKKYKREKGYTWVYISEQTGLGTCTLSSLSKGRNLMCWDTILKLREFFKREGYYK